MSRSQKRRAVQSRLSSLHQSDLLNYCGALGDDDGVEPSRTEQKAIVSDGRRRALERKTAQLCVAVRRVVEQLLTGECGDPAISGCHVLNVLPAPHAGRLRVVLEPPESVEPEYVLNALGSLTGWLRTEIAASIRRKKTPELTFSISHPNEEGRDD